MVKLSSLTRFLFQASVGIALSTLTVFVGYEPAPAQTRRIEIQDDQDIQALFDFVYRPDADPAPFRLQNADEQEAYRLLMTILESGTTVYVRATQDGNYGSYNVGQDVMVLRPSALSHWGIFLETLRHEGWHVVQACYGAQRNAENLIPVGLRVSRRTILNLQQNHSYPAEELPVEAEAFEAELYPNLTLQGLQEHCAPWLNN